MDSCGLLYTTNVKSFVSTANLER